MSTQPAQKEADNRPAVYVDNGVVIYRASAIGMCLRMLSALRLGYEPLPPTPETQARFDEGHLHEDSMCEWVEGRWDTLVINREKVIELPISSKVIIRGHIDGEIASSPDQYLENKSQSKDEFNSWKPDWSSGWFPKYKWSQSVYMHALGKSVLLVRKNRDNGEYAYQTVLAPFYSLEEIRTRILKIEAAAIRGELISECENSYPCPVYYLHEQREEGTSRISDDELDTLLIQHEKAKMEVKRWEGIQKESRKAIREAVEKDRYSTVGGNKVTFYMQKNPPSLNREKMKEDGVDVEKYMEQGESERMRVTLRKEKDNG